MSRLPVDKLRTNAEELDLGGAKVYDLPAWDGLSHPERLAVIRQIAEMRGKDPRIARLAVAIVNGRRVRPRDFKRQAAALLKWVQDPKNVYYMNEPGERLQDPIYTLRAKHGDCDDQVALLCAFFESCRLPWRLVLSGVRKDAAGNPQKVRYIEGQPVPLDVAWNHIYCMVGAPPYNPKVWWFAETTIQGVPLGWDVISGSRRYLPRVFRKYQGPVRVEGARRPLFQSRKKLPPANQRSPAYAAAYGDAFQPSQPSDYGISALGPIVGASLAAEAGGAAGTKKEKEQGIAFGIASGVAVALLAGILTPMFEPVIKKKFGPRLERLFGVTGSYEEKVYE